MEKTQPKCDTCEDTGVNNELCSGCAGSGEGMYDGSTCFTCKGTGTQAFECPDCDLTLPEENWPCPEDCL